VEIVKIMSKFVLGMKGVVDLMMIKPHYYQPHHKLITLLAVSPNVIKLSEVSVPYLTQANPIWIFLNHFQVELLMNVFYR
jgi:hypothetical protein